MKRVVSILAAIMLALTMAAPASADVDVYRWKRQIDQDIQAIMKAAAREYFPTSYVAVFHSGNPLDYTLGAHTLILFFNKPNPKLNDIYYFGSVASGRTDVFVNVSMFDGFSVNSNGFASGRASYGFFIQDRSASEISVLRERDPDGNFIVNIGEKVDTSSLDALIFQAEKKQELDYFPETWPPLQGALVVANALIAGIYTQVEVDAMRDRLQAALDGLVLMDLTPLRTLIEEAEQKQFDLYTAESWLVLQSALADAKVLAAGTPMQSQADAMRDRLQAALDGLVLLPPVDRSRLESLIARAESKKESDHDSEMWAILQDTLADSKTLLTGRPSQDEVDAMCERLARILIMTETFVIVISGKMLESLVDSITQNIAMILPIGIVIMAILLGVGFVPLIIKKFTST